MASYLGSLSLGPDRSASFVIIQKRRRAFPSGCACPAGSFVNDHRIPHSDIVAFERLVMRQKVPKFAVRNLLCGRFLRRDAQFPVLGKRPGDRRIVAEQKIVAPILPTVQIGRIRPEDHLVRAIPPVALGGVRAILNLTEDLLTR